MTTLTVSELFGPTIQGEGPHAGEPASFLRLGRCNLTCQWCDTPYTWDWTRFKPSLELSTCEVPVVCDQLHAIGVRLIVVTGGEPLAQQRGLGVLLPMLVALGHHVDVETNGTMVPDAALPVRCWVVSPKLENSGVAHAARVKHEALAAFDRLPAVLKFVVTSPEELDEVESIAQLAPHLPVWIMPEARTPGAVLDGIRELADLVAERHWHLSSRLQVIAWGPQRGH